MEFPMHRIQSFQWKNGRATTQTATQIFFRSIGVECANLCRTPVHSDLPPFNQTQTFHKNYCVIGSVISHLISSSLRSLGVRHYAATVIHLVSPFLLFATIRGIVAFFLSRHSLFIRALHVWRVCEILLTRFDWDNRTEMLVPTIPGIAAAATTTTTVSQTLYRTKWNGKCQCEHWTLNVNGCELNEKVNTKELNSSHILPGNLY